MERLIEAINDGGYTNAIMYLRDKNSTEEEYNQLEEHLLNSSYSEEMKTYYADLIDFYREKNNFQL